MEEIKTQNKEKEEETESRWEKEWTEEEWLKRIDEKQKELEEAEAQRARRKLQQGWELMRLCKEMMEMNGYNWRKSSERREFERNRLEEREERIMTAQRKKQNIMENERKRQIQRRITESLGELPNNKRILLEREIELEKRLLIKEAKEEIWKNGDRTRAGKKQTLGY